jgi:hypothetical protein
MNMKKIISLIFVLTFVFSTLVLSSCGKKNEGGMNDNMGNGTDGMNNLKLGVGVHSVMTQKSADGAKNGALDVTYTVAATVFGKDGKIVKCKLDAIETHANFSSSGKAITPSDFKSKQELGDSYVMSDDETKLKWYEQADAFAKMCEGKTVDEVKKLVADGGKGTDDVIKAGCTITVSEFALAVEKSLKDAKDYTAANVGDILLSLKVNANITDATDSANGKAELDGVFSAEAKNGNQSIAKAEKTNKASLTFDASGKISAK